MQDPVVHQKIESAYSYESTHEELFLGPDGLSLTDFGNADRFVEAEGEWHSLLWQKIKLVCME